VIADTELRRGLLSVTLPGSAGKRTILVVLGKKNLRFFTPPTPPDEAILTLGSPLPSGLVKTLECANLLYRKSSDRMKRSCVEVVALSSSMDTSL